MNNPAKVIHWQDALDFGIEELDKDHKALVSLFNRLYETTQDENGQGEAGPLLDELLKVVARHIDNERTAMVTFGYRDSPAHEEADRKFFAILEDVRRVFLEFGTLNSETVDFVKHLIIQHLITTDRPLRVFFRGQQGLQLEVNPYIQWLDSFGIGVAVIDTDHRHFIDLVNALKETIDIGGGKDTILELAEVFTAHAKAHCDREEALLKRLDYPCFDQHHDEHTRLIAALEKTCADLREGTREFGGDELLLLIKEWIIQHILFVDMKMKSFLDQHRAAI